MVYMHHNQITLSGKVIHGHHVGRKLGFPTANLDPAVVLDLNPPLAAGVYGCQVLINHQTYVGVFYYGPRFSSGATSLVAEVHVLDFVGALYDSTIAIEIGPFVREPENFSSVEALQKQIVLDILHVRKWAETT